MSGLVDPYGHPIASTPAGQRSSTGPYSADIAVRVGEELAAIGGAPCSIEVGALDLLCLVNLLQLALRHRVSDLHHAAAGRFILTARELFVDCPTITEVIVNAGGDGPAGAIR